MTRKKNVRTQQREEPAIYAIRKEGNHNKVERREFLVRLGLITGALATGCKDIDNTKTSLPFSQPADIPQNVTTGLCDNLYAHSISIRSLAISSDGKKLASGDSDSLLKLWSLTENKLTGKLEGATSAVTALAFSADGTMLAGANGNNLISIWTLSDKKLIKSLEGHTAQVNTLCISSDGKFLISGSSDTKIKIWSLPSGDLVRTLEGHTGSVTNIDISRDGNRIASISEDSSLKIWSLADGQLLKSATETAILTGSVKYSPDGRLLASTSGTLIKIWDLTSGELKYTLKGHSTDVTALAFNSDGTKLVSGSNDTTIRIWDPAKGKLILSAKGHSQSVEHVLFSNDSGNIISSGADRTIKIWNLSSYPVLEPDGTFREGLESYNTPCAESENKIAYTLPNGRVNIYDITSNQIIASVKVRAYLKQIKLLNDGEYLVISDYKGALKWWNLSNENEKKRIKAHNGDVVSYLFLPGNKQMVTFGSDTEIKLWSFPEGKLIRKIAQTIYPVQCAAISNDGRYLAYSSFTETSVISVEDGSNLKHLNGENAGQAPAAPDTSSIATPPQQEEIFTGNASDLMFDPVAAVLIIATSTGLILYDYVKGAVVSKCIPDDQFILSTVSNDGKYIATASSFGRINLFSSPELKQIKTIDVDTSQLKRIAFTGKDNKLVVYTASNVRLYEITDFIDDIILSSCLYDKEQLGEDVKGIQYRVGSQSMTLPCGSAIPEDAVCTCNCVSIGMPASASYTYYYTYYYTYWYPN